MKDISVKVDDILYVEAEQLFKKLGLDIDTAIRMFLVQAVNTESIPFEIKLSNRNMVDFTHPIINDMDIPFPND